MERRQTVSGTNARDLTAKRPDALIPPTPHRSWSFERRKPGVLPKTDEKALIERLWAVFDGVAE